jgi:hypothetical protein
MFRHIEPAAIGVLGGEQFLQALADAPTDHGPGK